MEIVDQIDFMRLEAWVFKIQKERHLTRMTYQIILNELPSDEVIIESFIKSPLFKMTNWGSSFWNDEKKDIHGAYVASQIKCSDYLPIVFDVFVSDIFKDINDSDFKKSLGDALENEIIAIAKFITEYRLKPLHVYKLSLTESQDVEKRQKLEFVYTEFIEWLFIEPKENLLHLMILQHD